MVVPEPVMLAEAQIHVRRYGHAELRPKAPQDTGSIEYQGETLIWDPQVEGLLVSENQLHDGSSEHLGERHLDGDELVYLISGAIQVLFEREGGSWTGVGLEPGQALLIPQGAWHRFLVQMPARLLAVGGGRTEVRPRA